MAWRQYCLIALMVGVTVSCTAFEGKKVATDGSPPDAKNGIPFSLPRPAFKLAITPDEKDATKAKFTLTASYVPDPTQTYTLRLDPGIFTNSSFSLKYSEEIPGALATVGGSVTDQVVPTITAIGTFTASLVGVAASAFLDEARQKQAGLAELIDKIESACATPVGSEIGADMRSFLPASLDPAEPPDIAAWAASERSIRTLYFFKTPGQRDCLAKVAKNLRASEVAEIEKEKLNLVCGLPGLTAEEKEKIECPKGPFPPDPNESDRELVNDKSSEFRAVFEEALNESDVASLTGLLQQVGRALASATDVSEKDIFLQQQVILRAAVKLAKRPKDGGTDRVQFLSFFALMPENVWRARYILFLRSQRGVCIAEAFQGANDRCLENVNAGNITQVIKQIDRAIAVAAGEKTRHSRLTNLEDFLDDVPDRDVQGGKAPAASEYVAIRNELDTLRQAYVAAVDNVVGQNKDAPELAAPEPPDSTPLVALRGTLDATSGSGAQNVKARDLFDVPIATSAFIAASQNVGWEPAGHPEFVIVVEPDIPKPPLGAK